MRAKGIDISHWQGTFEHQGNLNFIILKATEGEIWIDDAFEIFLKEAQRVPIRGAYHYFRTQYDGIVQANHFWETVQGKGFHFLAVDYEAKNNKLDKDGEAELYDLWVELESLTDLPILLYTSPYVYRDNLCAWDTFWLNVPLWMAHYNYEDPQEGSPLLFDAPGWKLWQYTNEYNGKYYGVGTEHVDQNVYNGSVKQLHEWLGPQGEQPMNSKWYTSKTFWFSVVFGLVQIAGIFGYGDFVPSPEVVQYVGIGLSVIGALVGVIVKYIEGKAQP